jgi:hydrogenase maturation protease
MRAGTILVIGYGNDLRGDDAAGRRAAAQVAAWALPGVEVRALHQLTPELAEPLAAAERAIFLDAHPVSCAADLRVHRLQPAAPAPRLAHTCDPSGLLALAHIVFGRRPEAWWITIPATDFAFGAPLSRLTERGIVDALATVRRLLVPSPPAAVAAPDPQPECPIREPAGCRASGAS